MEQYYRLKRVRQAVCNEFEKHDIVSVEPVKESQQEFRWLMEGLSMEQKTAIKPAKKQNFCIQYENMQLKERA